MEHYAHVCILGKLSENPWWDSLAGTAQFRLTVIQKDVEDHFDIICKGEMGNEAMASLLEGDAVLVEGKLADTNLICPTVQAEYINFIQSSVDKQTKQE